jgi:SAM-dependent methyltransferase
MRILDLGCGCGLTSIRLAQKYFAQVFATDLWIPAEENFRRFQSCGLDRQIVPIHADVHDLPFSGAYLTRSFASTPILLWRQRGVSGRVHRTAGEARRHYLHRRSGLLKEFDAVPAELLLTGRSPIWVSMTPPGGRV